MQTQGWTHNDHRSSRVINALSEKVLTETTLLTLDHVSQRFQRTLVRTCNGATTTTVVEQRINRFLQHTLFVAHDNVRRIQLEQTLETIVAVDHAAVEVVQVRRCETSAIKRNQWTQVRRQHRQRLQHHPLWLVARSVECFKQLQALGELLNFCLRLGIRHFFTNIRNLFFEHNLFK